MELLDGNASWSSFGAELPVFRIQTSRPDDSTPSVSLSAVLTLNRFTEKQQTDRPQAAKPGKTISRTSAARSAAGREEIVFQRERQTVLAQLARTRIPATHSANSARISHDEVAMRRTGTRPEVYERTLTKTRKTRPFLR